MFLGDKEALSWIHVFGVGNFKAEVQSLTDLLGQFFYTHGDKDHVGRAKQFQKRYAPCEFGTMRIATKMSLQKGPFGEGEQNDIGPII